MKRKVLLIFTGLFLFFWLSIPCIALEDEIVLQYEFDKPVIKEVTIAEEVYNYVVIHDTTTMGNAGEPSLPIKGAKILIPEGMQYFSSDVILGKPQEIRLRYPLAPAQREYPLSFIGSIDPTPPNREIYSQSTVFPDEDIRPILSVQNMRGYKIAIFNIFPARYIPSENKLLFYPNIELRVKLKPSEEKSSAIKKRSIQADLEEVLSYVDNKEDVPKELPQERIKANTTLLGQEGPFDYVIITNRVLADAQGEYTFQDLIALRQSKGLTATIVTTDDPVLGIYANYDGIRPDGGEDNQTKIRNFIIDAYNQWDTQYILLGGDGDTENVGGESGDNIIPVRYLFDSDISPTPPYFFTLIAADLYYSCLNGTFDSNASGIYGEWYIIDQPFGPLLIDEVDFFAEVYVGRAPVDSEEEVSNFVKKIFAYEEAKENRDPYLLNTYQIGEHLGGGGDSEWAKNSLEEIRWGSSNHGFTTTGIPEAFDRNAHYQKDFYDQYETYGEILWELALRTNIFPGNPHIINHLGHADETSLMTLSNSEVDNLDNTKYFIGYSQGCYAGAFDNTGVEYPSVSSDSIVEHFVVGPQGAVAFIANSRFGWGTDYSTYGSSQLMAREFWDAVFGESIYGLGKASQDSKQDNFPNLSFSYTRYCYLELNLFGDPALEVFPPTRIVPEKYPTIESAIDAAQGGDIVFVHPGRYYEYNLSLKSNISLIGAGPNLTVIDGEGSTAFDSVIKINEINNCLISNLHITDGVGAGLWMLDSQGAIMKNNIVTSSGVGIYSQSSNGLIVNNTITDSYQGIQAFDSNLNITNNIIVNNDFGGVWLESDFSELSYNNVWGNMGLGNYYHCSPGESDISVDPHFIDLDLENYHLQISSACVDAGDPDSTYSNEPNPNGGRINLGVYGNTPEATTSDFLCGNADGSGVVDLDDVVYLIAYIFTGGPAPEPLETGDADGLNSIDLDDVVYL
ncbi:MAG: C25 family cysteine peptidase, partial [Candidatus Omnitrophota bacterium]